VFGLQCIKNILKYVKNVLLNTQNQYSMNFLFIADFTTHTDFVAVCTKIGMQYSKNSEIESKFRS